MKRGKLLEYRIKRLERLMYEDAIDDELDSMADKINKDYKYTDAVKDAVKDAEDMADDILNSEDDYFNDPKSHNHIFNTIEEYLDLDIMDFKVNPARPKKQGVVDHLRAMIDDLSLKFYSLDLVRKFQKFIKEINKVNVLVAQQKLVNAIRKRIKIEKQEEDTLRNKHLDHWYEFLRKLKTELKDEIKRCTGRTYNVSYSSNQKVKYFEDLLSAEFTISDIVYKKSRTISFTIWEYVHTRWDIEHLYDVGTKTHWLELYKVDEDDVAKQIAKKLCWRLNGYEFDQGKCYPGIS